MYKNIIWHAVKKMGNLAFAIILLMIIILYSILGTLIEQEKEIEYYQNHYFYNNKPFFSIIGKCILYLQLDHVYTSWIFVFLLIILGFSLIICTFSTQLPSMNYARKWKFRKYYNQEFISTGFQYKLTVYSSILYILMKNNYNVFHQKKYVYGYKGLVGRLSPICVHISLIILLMGSLVTFFGGFIVQEMIPVGEEFHLQNVVKSGLFSNIPKNFFGKVTDFGIDYYDNKDIKQFYTKLIFLQHNNIINTEILSVNKPITIDNLRFYQTDWQVSGLRIEINNVPIQIPVYKLDNNNQNFWLSNLSYDKDIQFYIIFSNIDNKIFLYSKVGTLICNMRLNQAIVLNHTELKILDIIKSTGLQVKQDPGTLLVYLGFVFLIISTAGSYITYSQVWVTILPFNIYLSGFTNRADVSFEKEFILFFKYIN
jgi:cytochrome c biogenesis protein|uniref:Cytochrome c biogenesis protein CcsB n=1 Tax=Thorea hispida TaxID=202687 RepID=A0A1C9CAK1_9FLOR|nr:c-type cytochrome biogenensis protein [Thorea hispida]AOM65397.1 c-type cytochrome biogenensis protein [Thorea hispida]UNJ79036.1 c-type cytochrome biogenensis protein [Thorea hispida]